MAKPKPFLKEHLTSGPEAGADLPDPYFLEGWRLITGEPPAILLDSRAEMLALLGRLCKGFTGRGIGPMWA